VAKAALCAQLIAATYGQLFVVLGFALRLI